MQRIMTRRFAALVLVAAASAAVSMEIGQSGGSANPPPDQVLIAKGDSVFQGRLGGALCHVCHGRNAKGMPGLGSDLTDGTWLHGDGSLESIVATIKTGVARPKTSKTVMPPGGGVPLDSLRLFAVARYVHSLSAQR